MGDIMSNIYTVPVNKLHIKLSNNKSLKWDNINPKLNIIFGLNGSGKTLLLEYILKEYKAFDPFDENTFPILHRNIDYGLYWNKIVNPFNLQCATTQPNTCTLAQMRLYTMLKNVLEGQPNICCIDNIEDGLHIDVQRKLIETLLELAPDTQFFVVTNSPFIAEAYKDNLIDMEDIIV